MLLCGRVLVYHTQASRFNPEYKNLLWPLDQLTRGTSGLMTRLY